MAESVLDFFDPWSCTPREREVLQVVEDGARSLAAIARRLDPPVSRRTAEAHMRRIAEQIPEQFEPDSPGFWRVVMWSREHGVDELYVDPHWDEAQ